MKIRLCEFTDVERVDLINVKYIQPVQKKSSMCKKVGIIIGHAKFPP